VTEAANTDVQRKRISCDKRRQLPPHRATQFHPSHPHSSTRGNIQSEMRECKRLA
jgi:hypothetical protein